jgi:hypothetical protein
MFKEKTWVNFQRIIELFSITQKVVTKLSKIWVCDPGSGKKPIQDPGVKNPPDPGSGYTTLLTRYRYRKVFLTLELVFF